MLILRGRVVRNRRYALYSLLIIIVFVIGLPLTVFVLLYRRRHKLFGDASDPFVATTRSAYGFLYEVRGLDQPAIVVLL